MCISCGHPQGEGESVSCGPIWTGEGEKHDFLLDVING